MLISIPGDSCYQSNFVQKAPNLFSIYSYTFLLKRFFMKNSISSVVGFEYSFNIIFVYFILNKSHGRCPMKILILSRSWNMEQFACLLDVQSIKVLLDIPESYFFQEGLKFFKESSCFLNSSFFLSSFLLSYSKK